MVLGGKDYVGMREDYWVNGEGKMIIKTTMTDTDRLLNGEGGGDRGYK